MGKERCTANPEREDDKQQGKIDGEENRETKRRETWLVNHGRPI